MAFLWGILIFIVLGAFFGLILGIADKMFTVHEDPRLDELTDLLPGINCGTCGYPGCKEMAQGMLKGEVPFVSQCRPSRPNARKSIKEYLDTHPDEAGNYIKIDV